MNPVHLRTFLAVLKHLNYTRAAEELFLSQPAVSRQIRQLEQDLGLRLFEQIGKSLNLTDAGRTLADEAGKLLGNLERVAEAVRSHLSAESGRLRIGASTTPGLYLLPPVLGRFHARYSDVELHFAIENSLCIEQKILRNELDIGFLGAHTSHGELVAEKLLDDEIVCFASASHRLAKRRRIDAASLAGETWIIREKGSATRQRFESWLAEAGGTLGSIIELQGPEAVKALVAAGVGISFMSIHGLKREIRRRQFKKLPVTGLQLKRAILLVRHADKHTSPAMEWFLTLVRAMFADAGPSVG